MPGSRRCASSGMARSARGRSRPSRDEIRQRVSAKGRTLSHSGLGGYARDQGLVELAADSLRRLVFDADVEARYLQYRVDESRLEAVHYAEDDDEGGDADGYARGREEGRSRPPLSLLRRTSGGIRSLSIAGRISSPSCGTGRRP